MAKKTSALEEAYNKARNEQAKKDFQNTPSNWAGWQTTQASGGFNTPQTIDLDAVGKFLNMLKTVASNAYNRVVPSGTYTSFQQPSPVSTVAPISTPMPSQNLDRIVAAINAGYKTLGGATPALQAQIPIMAKQIQKNPYLYPIYPAIPFAETSLGKKVTYPGNNFNWGVTMNPYPLTGYSPEYITERVASRLTTDPKYAKFRASPSVQSLQESGYAPVGSNPYWNSNMNSAIQAFPNLDTQF